MIYLIYHIVYEMKKRVLITIVMTLIMVIFVPKFVSAEEIDTSYYYTADYIKKMKGAIIEAPSRYASLDEIILYIDYCCFRWTNICFYEEWEEKLKTLTPESKYMFGSQEKVEYTKRLYYNSDSSTAFEQYKDWIRGFVTAVKNADSKTSSDDDNGNNNAYYPATDDVDKIEGLTNFTDSIWATIITIVQAVAVGCVIFAGLRYMYASADKKADIKKGMVYLAIGAMFVFATSSVMKFIFSIGNSLL